jgi:plastocyanin
MRRLVSLTALLLALAGGCGDDDDEPGRTVTANPGETVQVVAEEYSFDPGNIVLTRPGNFRVRLDNQGSLAHNLRVLDGAIPLGGTPTFIGGDARTGVVRIQQPGEYKLECTVGDHAALGMTGKLTVR